MKSIVFIPIIFLAALGMVNELQPTLWGAGIIDDGVSAGLNLDYDAGINYAWGSVFSVGLLGDYYVFYPGIAGRYYMSDRSKGPVRLFVSGQLCAAVGAQEKSDGNTDLILGGSTQFGVGGDFITSDRLVPIVFLGGFLDIHSGKNVNALVLSVGLRF